MVSTRPGQGENVVVTAPARVRVLRLESSANCCDGRHATLAVAGLSVMAENFETGKPVIETDASEDGERVSPTYAGAWNCERSFLSSSCKLRSSLRRSFRVSESSNCFLYHLSQLSFAPIKPPFKPWCADLAVFWVQRCAAAWRSGSVSALAMRLCEMPTISTIASRCVDDKMGPAVTLSAVSTRVGKSDVSDMTSRAHLFLPVTSFLVSFFATCVSGAERGAGGGRILADSRSVCSWRHKSGSSAWVAASCSTFRRVCPRRNSACIIATCTAGSTGATGTALPCRAEASALDDVPPFRIISHHV